MAALAVAALIGAQIVFAVPPMAAFDFAGTNPVTPRVPDVGEPVNFTSSLGDTDTGQTYTYQWDFGDGGTSTAQHPSHTYNSPGTKTVTLTVSDSGGETDDPPVTRTLRVNDPPNAAISCSPNQAATAINCSSAGSTDAEAAIARYEWDLDGNGFNDGSDASETFVVDPGTYTIRLRVTDSDGATDIAQQTVTLANDAPTASITAVTPLNPQNGNVPYVGQQIRFEGSGTDPNGDNVSYSWDFGDGTTAGGPTVTHAFNSATPRNKTVTLTVSDGTDTGTDTTQVTVNALPVARANSLNPQAEPGQKYNVPLIGQPILFTGEPVPALPGASAAPGCPTSGGSPAATGSTDAEAAIARYEWDLDGDGTFETDRGADPDAPFPGFSTAGPKTVGLRVTDSDQATATTTLQLRVNTPPTADFVFEPLTPIIGQEITFGSTSSDPDPADAGKHIYSWDLDNDGTFCEPGETGASVKRSFPTANTSPGHRVRLRITDDGGITRERERNVVVQNTIPTAGIGFAPESPLPGQPVTFNSNSSPTAGKELVGHEWDFDYQQPGGDPCGAFVADTQGTSVSHAFSSPGPKTVALKVAEVQPGGGPETGGCGIVVRTINVNAPPQARFSVAPESAFVGDTVTLSSTSVDPDGPLAMQEWDLDNDGQFDDANAAVVSARFNSEGTHPLKLRVTDSRGATSTATGQVIVRTRPVPPPPPTPLLNGVIISGRFLLFRSHTKIRFLRVRAPAGSMIRVRCSGKKKCPKRLTRRQLTKRLKKAQRVQFNVLQRRFRPGAKLIITVTKSGFIGRQTTFKLRRRKPPVRRDLCLPPGAKKASACPSG